MPANSIKAEFSHGEVSLHVFLNQLSLKDPQQELSKKGLRFLEETHLEHVPGTALLTDVVELDGPEHHHRRRALDASLLKHDEGKVSDVSLVPQPSNSPDDPSTGRFGIRSTQTPIFYFLVSQRVLSGSPTFPRHKNFVLAESDAPHSSRISPP